VNLADYLLTPEGLGDLLDQLASPVPDPQLVGDGALCDACALQILAAMRRATSHGGDDNEPAQVLVRFVAAQTGKHIDRVRSGYKPHVLGGTLLFVARHLWPAYEVWMGNCHPMGHRLSVPGCIHWLRSEGMLDCVLQGLCVSAPAAKQLRLAVNGYTRTDSTHYNWSKWARAEVHAQVKRELDDLLKGEIALGWESQCHLRRPRQAVRRGARAAVAG
jgi:hypothetical protein